MLSAVIGGRARWAFSDRAGGTSGAPYDSLNLGGHVGDDPTAVLANRARLADDLGVPVDSLVFMDQVHGASVCRVDAEQPVAVPSTDGVVTTEPGLVLVVLVADCVPVLLADPVAGVVAAVHAGRPGVHRRIVLEAVREMAAVGARPETTTALLGPSVCAGCYEVPDAMRAEVAAAVPATWATSRTGTPALDLRAGLAAELAAEGIVAEAVGPCTAESPHLFSYRRDGRTGRFAGAIWLDR